MDSVNKNINLSEYEVVRQDYFFNQEEPQFTFCKGRAYINSFGLRRFPDMDYIQVMVYKNERRLVIKPLKSKAKDSVKWCAGRKRHPRHMRCVPLYCMVYELMGWDKSARYRITGFVNDYGETPIIVFDLDDAICYVKEIDEDSNVNVKQIFSAEWEMNFGKIKGNETDSSVKICEDDETFEIKLPIYEKNLRNEVKNNGNEQ